jgi:3-dehydroquinate dehydratase
MLGLKSSKTKANVTLDKINRALKKHVKGKNVSLKFLQTHKQFQAINFLQRNRNWADGILFIPTSWARNEFTILETLELINLKTATIYFNDSFSFGTDEQDSIIVGDYIQSFTGDPLEACVTGLEHLLS